MQTKVCRFFFTGKYETTRQPKKSRIFPVGEKTYALRAMGLGTCEIEAWKRGFNKNKRLNWNKILFVYYGQARERLTVLSFIWKFYKVKFPNKSRPVAQLVEQRIPNP
jgi:hypothetical protein